MEVFYHLWLLPAKKERKHMEETQGRQVTKKGEPLSSFVSRLSKDEATVQGSRFRVFRNKTRIRILDLLIRYGGLLCVVEIAEVLNEHPALISSHLATLRAVKLVSREMHGAYAYYFVNTEALNQYQQFLEQLTLHGVPS